MPVRLWLDLCLLVTGLKSLSISARLVVIGAPCRLPIFHFPGFSLNFRFLGAPRLSVRSDHGRRQKAFRTSCSPYDLRVDSVLLDSRRWSSGRLSHAVGIGIFWDFCDF
jgi:hypothetical protein